MDAEVLEELKRDRRFDDARAAKLASVREKVAPHFEGIVETFYERLLANPRQAEVFEDEAQVARQKAHLRDWLQTLLGGVYDHAYFVRRSRIGKVHVAIGLPSRYMVSMMGVLREGLERAFEDELDHLPASERTELADVLRQVLDLELVVMLESYREDSERRLQAKERLATLGQLSTAIGHELRRRPTEGGAMIFGLDAQGQVVFANDADALFPADHGPGRLVEMPALRDAVAKIRSGPIKTAVVETEIDASGHARAFRWTLTRLADVSAGVAIVAVGTDVSDERRRRRERTEREALAAVGLLTAGLAHEIRNPLNAASLQLHLLRKRAAKQPDADGLGAKIDIVEHELARLTTMLDEFLTLARPDTFTTQDVDLGGVLERVVQLERPVFEAHGLTLELEVAEAARAVRGDAARLEQVVLNLVRNAREAMRAHDLCGRVQVRAALRGDGLVLVTVDDEGPGVPAGEDLFQPFVTTKAAGTGLGLSIVAKIVSLHGGELGLQPRDEGGARAWFTLPPRR